uniref:Uncharacterized protein n=1 Tax=Anguilla anguilla TaxID=7936 RepID=A0A0E9VCM5_ANGAN
MTQLTSSKIRKKKKKKSNY